MAKILPFKKKTIAEKHKGNTLCRQGHHKWMIDNAQKFDVREGALVTVYYCERCGESKRKLT